MTQRFKVIAAASALCIAAVLPAAADYSILEDSSLPSVLFIEFEGDVAEPSVIEAPAPTISSGGSSSSSSSSSNSSEPKVVKPDETSSSSGKSVEDRVNEKIAELEANAPESVENIVIDNEIDKRILEKVEQ